MNLLKLNTKLNLYYVFRKNLRLTYFYVYTTLFFCTLVNAQDLSFDLGELIGGNYEPQKLEAIRSMKNGLNYTVIEEDELSNTNLLVSYAYSSSLKREILFDSNQFPKKIKFSGYTFSKDEQKILLETYTDQIYRRSKQAIYWIYNIETKSLEKLNEQKVQEP